MYPISKAFKPLLKHVTLIFCDIDGTLLNEKSRLDDRTILAVKRISTKIPIILISGRSVPLMLPIHQALELTTPLIGANGSILASSSGKTISAHPMAKDDYIRLIDFVGMREDIAINVYTDTRWYTNRKDNPHVQKEEIIVDMPAIELTDLSKLNDTMITKLILMGELSTLTKVQSELEHNFPHIRAYHNYENYIEIFAYEAEKGLAIQRYLTEHNLDESTIMAIGDSLIDASMFNYVKIKVAMENGSPSLKAKADIIAPSNREHGVAILLEMMDEI